MCQITCLIIDNSVIGRALRECLIHFCNVDTDQVSLVPDPVSKLSPSRLLNKIHLFLEDCNDEPLLIFINLNYSFFSDTEQLLPGLEIAEEIRLAKPKSAILLYSFDSKIFLRRIDHFTRFMAIPGSSYFSLPTNIQRKSQSWCQIALESHLSHNDSADVLLEIFSMRATNISKRYLGDLNHSVVDKILPLIIEKPIKSQEARYRIWLRDRICALFGNDISDLCGIDIHNVFADEWREIHNCLERLEVVPANSDEEKREMAKEYERIRELLSEVIARLRQMPGKWNTTLSFEQQMKSFRQNVDCMKGIFSTVWDVDLWKLGNNDYQNLWKDFTSSVDKYFTLRSKIELSLWIMSVWALGRYLKTNLDRLFFDFLDPLMVKIGLEDYKGASEIFTPYVLEALKVEKGTSLSDFFRGEDL